MNQSELEANTRNRYQARENACDQVVIGFGFSSAIGWVGGASFFKPITERSNKSKTKAIPRLRLDCRGDRNRQLKYHISLLFNSFSSSPPFF